MTTKVFFNEDCRQALISELRKAEQEIIIAVAWFNDNEIYNILVEKAKNGKKIELLISNDPNNFGNESSLNFNEFIEFGGKFYRLITENVLMHNKYCVIDNHTLITGSYNWTYGAHYKNLENIVVIENDIKVCDTYKEEFNRIVKDYFTYIEDFDNLLQRITERVNELRQQNKRGVLDPNWIMSILNKNPGQFMLTSEENQAEVSSDIGNTNITSLYNWWNNLPYQWKLYFNDKILPNGRTDSRPSEDALLYLKSINKITCLSYYTNNVRNGREYVNYHVDSINGLESLTELKVLEIRYCNLTQKSLEMLSSLTSLIKLDLSQNKISALPLNYRLNNLVELDISSNLFESLDFLNNLPNLEILNCSSNKLTGTKGIERAHKLRLIFIDKAVYILPFVNSKLINLGFEEVDYASTQVVKLERVI